MNQDLAADESGSALPLIIGYAALALAVILVCVNATSLLLAQKRLDALADAAALAASDGFVVTIVDGQVGIELDPHAAEQHAVELIGVSPVDARIDAIESVGGASARVTVSGEWEPLLLDLFVPDGVALSATGTSRAALAG
ncbi:pilus assembly protein TadG-related protein [Microbacterium sp. G2-8]|uniref:pilus assembly protein TadG-related protein n=1 Tax=Microbacterium sp. G2-8 TaxID=2842454 RepID=UPI001C8A2BFE|nr:pilus assembly protein TadG-related protein [Microbacterium sp. G2-8]